MDMGTGWKTYAGIGLWVLASLAEQLGISAQGPADFGQLIGMGLAAFGFRHKMG